MLTYKLLDDNEDVITCFSLKSDVVDRKGENNEEEDSDEFGDEDDYFE